MGVPRNKYHETFAREPWIGEDPEDRDNLVHIADNKIDFENGALTIDADGLTSTTADITAHVGTFTSDLNVAGAAGFGQVTVGTGLEVAGLANFVNTVVIGETATLPGGETVSIELPLALGTCTMDGSHSVPPRSRPGVRDTPAGLQVSSREFFGGDRLSLLVTVRRIR